MSSHVDSSDEGSKLSTGGYYCPQCCSKYCELPVECRSCGLTLVSAPHLARSYHHLFPASNYTEIERQSQAVAVCYACQKEFGETDKNVSSKRSTNRPVVFKVCPFQVYQCNRCVKIFCVDCDIFVHDVLHTCPGCATNSTTLQNHHNSN